MICLNAILPLLGKSHTFDSPFSNIFIQQSLDVYTILCHIRVHLLIKRRALFLPHQGGSAIKTIHIPYDL